MKVFFEYFGKLAGAPNEVLPRLHWWSSVARNEKSGTSSRAIKWKDEKTQVSERQSVTLNLGNGKFRRDESIWVECIVKSPSEEGFYVGARAGTARISLLEVQQAGGSFETELDLEMPQMHDESRDSGYVKGKLRVSIADPAAANWKFEEASPYDLSDYASAVTNLSSMTSMFPYGEKAYELGLGWRPSVDRLEAVHAPYWVANVTLPGWTYWVEYSPSKPSEQFAQNLARVALARHSMSESDFVATVRQQFSETVRYHPKFTKCVALTMDAFAIVAVSLYYKSDETYVKRSGSLFSSGGVTRKSIESFNDALLMDGDDCEGLGSVIHRVFRIFREGMTEHRDSGKYWKRNGGWKDDVLDCMQRITYWYVSGGSLGSVTAARVGSAEDQSHPLVIDSENDKRASMGAHMWQESIPVPKFERLVAKTSPSAPHLKLRDAAYPKWLDNLPHTVGEGTGAVHPLLKPSPVYFPKDSDEAADELARFVGLKCLKNETSIFPLGQVQRIQKMRKDKPDSRYSDFYRRSTTFDTDDLLREGYPVAQLVWSRLSPRRSEKERSRSETSRDDWTWGVNMRDKLKNPGEDHVGLVAAPPLDPEEIRSVRSLMRHLAPLTHPILTAKGFSRRKKRVLVQEFAKRATELLRAKKEAKATGTRAYVDVVFRRNEFFIGKIRDANGEETNLRDALLDDVNKAEHLREVEAFFEPITDTIYNVRVRLVFYVDELDDDSSEFEFAASALPSTEVSGSVYYFPTEAHQNAFENGVRQNEHFIPTNIGERRAYELGKQNE